MAQGHGGGWIWKGGGGIKATLQVRMRLTVGERRGKEVIGVDG